jgi:hypothetical protein
MSLSRADLENRFGFRNATTEGPNPTAQKHLDVRETFIEFADFLNNTLPDGRAKSIAMTELETASMWAHKALSQPAE